MEKDYSPFVPGQPISPEFFVGREEQVQHLVSRIRQTLSGRLEMVFVGGERGIGKTSLAQFVRWYVERDLKVVGSYTHLGGVQDISEAVRRSIARLIQESDGKPWHKRLRQMLRAHIRQVGLLGVTIEFTPPSDVLQSATVNFSQTLKQLFNSLRDEARGLLLVWDDINGLARTKTFADWLRSVADETAMTRIPFTLILVGLQDLRLALIQNNESLARVLFPLDIPLWSQNECGEFFRSAFDRVKMTVMDDALTEMVDFAGGHPALAHEIGDAVFRMDRDGTIDHRDAREGIFQAAEIVGRKYLEPQVYNAIRSPRYRKILQVLTGNARNLAFQRAELLRRLDPEARDVFDNFLRRMQQLGVIIPDTEGGRGSYRFRNRLHFLYFAMETKRTTF
ncbi:MAG: ATP-binding protein [Armatimonadetes bacterium]|nr:ATP-binding protein [Armatimonadota bacterium]MDW8120829.1 ATP-binding protein [Armatimonadota bacterium]